MTSTTADRVTLILDCLGHDETDLTGQSRLWRHRDGRYVTEDEAAMIEESTVGEIRDAMDLWQEEVRQLTERCQLFNEFGAIIRRYSAGSGDLLRDIMARLRGADRKRAIEIWQQIGPSFEAWYRDQS